MAAAGKGKDPQVIGKWEKKVREITNRLTPSNWTHRGVSQTGLTSSLKSRHVHLNRRGGDLNQTTDL